MVSLQFKESFWCNLDVALRRMDTLYYREFEVLGLSPVEACILQLLYEQDGQMASRLAYGVGRPATSFTPILDVLEKKGFIERRAHPSDRRAVKIHLTDQGKAIEEQVRATSERIDTMVAEQFSETDWQEFQQALAGCQAMTG
jgi:MarR family transcriptional regulator, organic hydroperoxide resistance regulator